ncbi:MAG: hypothetical protein ACRENI_06440 [Gemmatimonadaceae bacterium]
MASRRIAAATAMLFAALSVACDDGPTEPALVREAIPPVLRNALVERYHATADSLELAGFADAAFALHFAANSLDLAAESTPVEITRAPAVGAAEGESFSAIGLQVSIRNHPTRGDIAFVGAVVWQDSTELIYTLGTTNLGEYESGSTFGGILLPPNATWIALTGAQDARRTENPDTVCGGQIPVGVTCRVTPFSVGFVFESSTAVPYASNNAAGSRLAVLALTGMTGVTTVFDVGGS